MNERIITGYHGSDTILSLDDVDCNRVIDDGRGIKGLPIFPQRGGPFSFRLNYYFVEAKGITLDLTEHQDKVLFGRVYMPMYLPYEESGASQMPADLYEQTFKRLIEEHGIQIIIFGCPIIKDKKAITRFERLR